jgi:hypothetical protein
MNNGKYYTERYKALQQEKNNNRFGHVEMHTKSCVKCNNEFVYTGRKKTKGYENAKFCSRSCANSRQEWWNENAVGYRTIALRCWEHKCAICGFDKIIAIHHVDENHSNNNPVNLIPLCPNHHEMMHSKWKPDVKPLVDMLVKEKWGVGANKNTSA